MKIIKLIDLLNKIANGEEVPEKIKYESYIYWYDKDLKDYRNAQVEYRSYLISCKYHNTDFLNDEVEIIEDTPKEDKKIKKLDLDELNDLLRADLSYDNLFHKTHKMLVETKSKINEIIDKINGE